MVDGWLTDVWLPMTRGYTVAIYPALHSRCAHDNALSHHLPECRIMTGPITEGIGGSSAFGFMNSLYLSISTCVLTMVASPLTAISHCSLEVWMFWNLELLFLLLGTPPPPMCNAQGTPPPFLWYAPLSSKRGRREPSLSIFQIF